MGPRGALIQSRHLDEATAARREIDSRGTWWSSRKQRKRRRKREGIEGNRATAWQVIETQGDPENLKVTHVGA